MNFYVQLEADNTYTAVRQNADGTFTTLASHVSKPEAEAAVLAAQGTGGSDLSGSPADVAKRLGGGAYVDPATGMVIIPTTPPTYVVNGKRTNNFNEALAWAQAAGIGPTAKGYTLATGATGTKTIAQMRAELTM